MYTREHIQRDRAVNTPVYYVFVPVERVGWRGIGSRRPQTEMDLVFSFANYTFSSSAAVMVLDATNRMGQMTPLTGRGSTMSATILLETACRTIIS